MRAWLGWLCVWGSGLGDRGGRGEKGDQGQKGDQGEKSYQGQKSYQGEGGGGALVPAVAGAGP